MFDFLRKSGLQRPSDAIRRALEADGLPPGTDLTQLGVVESRGNYAGRKVTYFRVFDPTRAAAHGADVFTRLAYRDLDAHPDLVLRAGFVEREGTVKITPRPASIDAAISTRQQADRSQHRDDEKVVFPDREEVAS
jgi:hypothetical protein